MSALLQTMHNQRIPPLPDGQRTLRWLQVGEGLQLHDGRVLAVLRERRAEDHAARLMLLICMSGGNALISYTAEGLNYFCTDVLVRCVESEARGPLRVLVEIGDMVAFPSLRDVPLSPAREQQA